MFKLEGFDELKRELKDIQQKASDLESQDQHDVSFDVLFNESFMSKHTSSSSFEQFLIKGGFVVNSKEDFENIPADVFSAYIQKETSFNSWEQMIDDATGEHVAKLLGF